MCLLVYPGEQLKWLAYRKRCLVREAFKVGDEVEVRLVNTNGWSEARVVSKTRSGTYGVRFKDGTEEKDVDPMRMVHVHEKQKDWKKRVSFVEAVEVIESAQSEDIVQLSDALRRAASFLNKENKHDEAEAALALESSLKDVGWEDNAEIARFLSYTAHRSSMNGSFEEAAKDLSIMCTIFANVYGDRSLALGDALEEYVLALEQCGRYNVTLQKLSQLLNIRRTHFKENQESVVRTKCIVGRVLITRGMYGRAKAMLTQALASYRQLSQGNDSQKYSEQEAQILKDLGKVYERMCDYTEAERVCKQCFEKSRSILLERGLEVPSNDVMNYPAALDAADTLAMVLLARNEVTDARILLQRSIHVRRQLVGSQDPSLAIALCFLARVYEEQSKLDEAVLLCEEAMNIGEVTPGPKCAALVFAMSVMGSILVRKQDWVQARTMFEQSLKIGKVEYGEKHPICARALLGVGMCFEAQGDPDGSLTLCRRALELLRSAYGQPHIEVAEAMHMCALKTLHAKPFWHVFARRDAVRCGKSAMTMCVTLLGPNHPRSIELVSTWGQS
jgi:tetratricopeptide (TPR) repeat protein